MNEHAALRQSPPQSDRSPFRNVAARPRRDERRPGRVASTLLARVIVELTAATAYIHLTLGGLVFTINGLGYLGLAAAYGVAAALPIAAIQRFGWLPRIGLAGYTLVTIGAYLVIGPYFALGWIAKGIDVALVALLVVDLLDTYGNPRGLLHAVIASLTTRPGPRTSRCVTAAGSRPPRALCPCHRSGGVQCGDAAFG
jgi:hypothetical protein